MKPLIIVALIATVTIGHAAERQTTFDFHSNFWVNLHHFLYEQAIAKQPEPVDAPEWQAAMNLYRKEIVKYDLLSRDISGINTELTQLDGAASLKGAHLSADLVQALEGAAPFYRARWWPQHDRANRAWIEAATPLVAKNEAVLRKELAAAYQTPWPSGTVRTDVTEYASWSGGYTTVEPTHITISSTALANQGDAALEILFHEASHGLIRKVMEALSAQLDAQNKLFQRRQFWHALLFYTVGEYVRASLDDYTPYAVRHGLYDRSWQGANGVLKKDWQPYLDGRIDMTTAVKRMVDDYGVPR